MVYHNSHRHKLWQQFVFSFASCLRHNTRYHHHLLIFKKNVLLLVSNNKYRKKWCTLWRYPFLRHPGDSWDYPLVWKSGGTKIGRYVRRDRGRSVGWCNRDWTIALAIVTHKIWKHKRELPIIKKRMSPKPKIACNLWKVTSHIFTIKYKGPTTLPSPTPYLSCSV